LLIRKIRIQRVEAVAPRRYRVYGTGSGGVTFVAEVRLRRLGTAWEADCLNISVPSVPVEKIETWCERHYHLLEAEDR
jgi:hypothetical protein